MDEPFASLDDEKRAEMRDVLRSLLDDTGTTLILVTHSRDDAFNLARRVVVLEHGRQVADDLLETLLIRPRHAAVVRALGLGQLLTGMVSPQGQAETAFGRVRTTSGTRPGAALILVRPDQPRLASEGVGVEAEVLSLELRPSAGRHVCRVAVVRAGKDVLRVFTRERASSIGERVRVLIEGECDSVRGE